MKVARIAAIGAVAAAVTVGTAFDVRRPRQIPRHGEYFVLQGDFHVHAALGDGGLAPWELRREAERRGLDVIAVTNHNQLLGARAAAAQSGRALPIVLLGQEITAPGFHMSAAGINETIDWRLTPSQAIRAVHEQGGVAIAAHPVPVSWTTTDADALRLMDGTEVAHPLVIHASRHQQLLLDFHRRAADSNPSLAPIGSSDFHWGGHLGRCRTFLFVREVSAAGVIEAVREARTVAFDGDDRLIGDPELVRATREVLNASPPPIATDRMGRFAAWLALVGLAALVVLG